MALLNTKHLIKSSYLTVICIVDGEGELLGKTLHGLGKLYYMAYIDGETIDKLSREQDHLPTIGLNGFLILYNSDIVPHNKEFATYACRANTLINFTEQNNVHLLATVLLDKHSDWRHIYFKIAEKNKDKVCFVRFAKNNSDIRLQIESGENAGQYIPYCLDDDGNLNETY